MFDCIETTDSIPQKTEINQQKLRVLLINYYVPSLTCYQNQHIVHITFSVLFIIIFFALCLVLKQTLTDSITSSSELNEPFSTVFDIRLLMSKALLCLLFSFFGVRENSWILLAVLLFSSFGLLYTYNSQRPHSNEQIKVLYLFSLCLFSWGSIVGFIGKVLEFTDFNGCIPLYLLGIPIIVVILFSEYRKPMNELLHNITSIKDTQNAIEQIRLYLTLLNEKEKNRQAKIIMKGFVHQHETTCKSIQCPLKKYIASLNKGIGIPVFLLQYAEILFQNAISKFHHSFNLRIYYCKFLLQYLNKKQQVNQELISLEDRFSSFTHQFIIYHFKHLLEEHFVGYNEEEENSRLMNSIVYNRYLMEFKKKINLISMYYFEFWTLILNNHKNPNQLTQLNDYSTKINNQIEELKVLFDSIEKLKTNNKEALYYYSIFLKDILNDKEKAELYEKKYNDAKEVNQTTDDPHYFNFDVTELSSSDKYQYIILSGNNQTFGLITNISLGVCLILGYSKAELIGKLNEIILPEIYHDVHKHILNEKINELKKEMVDAKARNNSQPSFKNFHSFARSKAKYLVPVSLQVAIICTETQNISFIAKINHESGIEQNTICQVITDPSFVIQNFTVHAVSLLGMNSNVMNHSLELTSLIKEFSEEYLKLALNNDGLSSEQKIQLKRHIINKKYRHNASIMWRGKDSKIEKVNSRKRDSIFNLSGDFYKSSEDSFLLKIEDIDIRSHFLGYIFKFERIDLKYYNGYNKSYHSFNSVKDFRYVQKIIPNSSKSIIVSPSNRHNKSDNNYEEISCDQFKKYIPEAKSNCSLDLTKMSYHFNKDNPCDFKEIIKKQAIEKIKTIFSTPNHTLKASDNDSSSYSEEISDSENEDSKDNSSQSNSNEVKSIQADISLKLKNDYYKVNMDNIKYSIYSFEKGMIVEIPNYQKKSQIDCKMNDSKELPTSEAKVSKSEKESENKTEENAIVKVNKDELLIHQIECALFQKENNQSIAALRIISFGILFYFLLLGGAFLYVLIDSEIYLKEGFQMLQFSSSICYNALYIHSNVRDLIILSHEKYFDSLFNKDKKELTTDFISQVNQFYLDSSQLIFDIMTTFVPLTRNSSFFLNNKTISSSIIRNDLNVLYYNTTVHEVFIEVNTAAYHIMTDLTTFLPTNNWVFFYISNINNELFLALMEQKDIFFNELLRIIFNHKVYLILTISIGFVLMIGTFFIFSQGYDAVSKQKESYLEVFFEINLDIITSSLEKCERFVKKIQYESFHNLVSTDESFIEEDSIANNSINPNKQVQDSQKRQSKLKETMIIKLYYSLFIIFVMLFLLLEFIFSLLFLNKLKGRVSLFNSQNDANIEYIKLYRNLREYLFDSNSIIESEISSVLFIKHLNVFYSLIEEKQTPIKEFKEKMSKEIQDMYYFLYYNTLWELLDINLSKVNNSFFSSPSYGLKSVQSNFIEEIRTIKNEKIRYKTTTSEFQYNMTLMGLDGYIEYPKDPIELEKYLKYHPMELFKSISYQRIKMIFDLFIRPGFSYLYKNLINDIDNGLKINILLSYCFCGVYFFAVICVFLFIWIPFEKGLHNTIFKTKNMLSRIPKEILGTLTNVRKLLNIDSDVSHEIKK